MSIALQLEEDAVMKKINEYADIRDLNGLETTWSIFEVDDINKNCPIKVMGRKIRYESVRPDATAFELLEDLENGGQNTNVEYTTTVKGNTWLDMWKAAEEVILKSGTHHRYIEDFNIQDDGSFILITGS